MEIFRQLLAAARFLGSLSATYWLRAVSGGEDDQKAAIVQPALLGAIWTELCRFAEDRPLAIIVDDVQFADPASVQFLRYFARRVAKSPILLVLGEGVSVGAE